jgi:prophage antirepressor-like protein
VVRGGDVLAILLRSAAGKGNAYRKLDETEKRKVDRINLGLSPGKPMTIITESGLYKLVLRSDKPDAKEFQDHVTKVILPAIRKDGAYIDGEGKPTPVGAPPVAPR